MDNEITLDRVSEEYQKLSPKAQEAVLQIAQIALYLQQCGKDAAGFLDGVLRELEETQ